MLSHRDLAQRVLTAYKSPATIDVGSDARCVVETLDDEIVIAFPGTSDLAGWLRDFSAWPVADPNLGLLHEGFQTAARGLWGNLEFLEKESGVEVGCVSTGPERNETIRRPGTRFEGLTR